MPEISCKQTRGEECAMKKVWLKLCSAVLFTMVVTPLAYAGTANFYNITLQGTVLGRPFARQGILAFTTPIPTGTTNGANPFEVVIVSGNRLYPPKTERFSLLPTPSFLVVQVP
jgi:hypothetical protein